jgi:hypothetical protein
MIDESRRNEIIEEERVRAEAQRKIHDKRFADWFVSLVCVAAPIANLLALDNRSWPYWAWLVVGIVLAALYFRGRQR